MTPEERLALLEDLKSKEPAALRKASIAGWASVLLAAVVTAALLFGGYMQLGKVKAQVQDRREELGSVSDQLEAAKKQLQVTTAKLGAWQKVVSQIPKATLDAGFERASQSDPSVTAILPRVYIQTPKDGADRAKAAQQKLRQAGFVVPGIEIRPEAVTQTEVRYYKKTEEPQAQKIADALTSIGERVKQPLGYLKRFENSTAVRPNHYEVWLGSTPQ